MLKAILDNKIVYPSPNHKALCPHCYSQVIAKCGSFKIWHWAHEKKHCDSWYEPETEWHLNWKEKFGINNVEIRIQIGGQYHVADVVTKDNVVIEFQNSPIKINTILERENFYGPKMLWIVNASLFKENFLIADNSFEYSEPLPFNYNPQTRIVDFHGLDLTAEEERWMYTHFFNKQGKLYNLIPFYNWTDEYSIKIKLINKRLGIKGNNPKKYFKWKHLHQNWRNSNRNIFLDFGDETLFWINNWMGSNVGFGQIVLKSKFISKYS